ncbi:pyruvate dehydrogenase complex dihydrolipoamide acetyltransferase [Solitalea koreensis]|uniref:Acetyltransferase component of pyruvate dehydrogenase complex n=1 Tax=Solitalea koreensis TaxID=543615 RepID=A0A521B1K4_9SPHI|nr:pyruvate dehydrogenase complex dihydrolipoamide acetyltransferase [Solitalea koreensis]SMO40974.1 pyruvate dehydrogenase E2 component (dihydrolipoamide acetyltransferase) [Solitalea koreensis]
MAEVVRMPKMSDTMSEGVLAKWHKKVGDKVKSGDLVAEVETDKATMDFESFQEGTLLYIGVEEGQAVPVDAIIAVLGNEGEDYKSLLTESAPAESKVGSEPVASVAEVTTAIKATAPSASAAESDSRVKASPLAKKIAEEKGIDLSQIAGSADGGRIVKKDVEAFTPATASASTASSTISASSFAGQESYTEVPVSQMRKVIAKRLSESKFTAPHFYLKMTINMDKAIETRSKLNEMSSVKISFNDMVLKAVAVALKQHPNVNSSWLGDKIRYNNHVNIGVAVAVEDGLLVPVVRFADGKSLSAISTEVKDFAQRAKAKKLQPSDWEGSTFTISNLGMFGLDEFTAIINSPDSCILAVGGIKEVPVVKNGQIVPGNEMKVTLSCDHRVVDGATGAAFLQTLKNLLEEPLRMLV